MFFFAVFSILNVIAFVVFFSFKGFKRTTLKQVMEFYDYSDNLTVAQ